MTVPRCKHSPTAGTPSAFKPVDDRALRHPRRSHPNYPPPTPRDPDADVEAPALEYACPQCPARFPHPAPRNRHVELHHP